MLLGKQIDRTVAKVARLGEVYNKYLTEHVVSAQVFWRKGQDLCAISCGQAWGADFAYATFECVAQGLDESRRYYLSADTGATEHLVSVNGKKTGLIDYCEHQLDGVFRVHRYLPLDGLKNGDKVEIEAYYSHPFPGTMPFDNIATYALDGLYPQRPFNKVEFVAFDETLKLFCDKLDLLNKHYASTNANSFARADIDKVYVSLFALLPQSRKPTQQETLAATKLIDDYFDFGVKNLPQIGIVGHSHLDTAWLWTVEETKHKLLRTLSNAVTLLEKYPDYKFFMSTVLYLDWVEKLDPQLFARVQALVAQGRLEPNGATWVECDGNLTGSEAFVRQFVRGKRYLRDKMNFESDVFWLPDTFGYSAALPQIMQGCGVKYFLTTKLSWNDTNAFPYETFRWKGIDGSGVTVHFNTIHCKVDDKTLSDRLQNVADKHESNYALVAYGFGDGGGGPSEDMVKQALFTQEHCKFADVRHTTVSEFMRKVDAQPLPDYCGDLYLELHRGTFTTDSAIKQNNRRLEEALHNAELVSVFDGENNKKDTDELYDVLMLNQFHDILPGTCIAQATDVALSEQKQALSQACEIVRGSGNKTKLFNTLGVARTELVDFDGDVQFSDVEGKTQNLALYRFEPYGYGKKIRAESKLTFDGTTVKTPSYTAKVQDGLITSFVWQGREFVASSLGKVVCYEDVPYIYDNWDVDADYTLKGSDCPCLWQKIALQTESLLVVRAQFAVKNSLLTRDIIFRADTSVVEWDNKLDFADTHTFVKTYFDTTLFARQFSCETQFGNVKHNTLPAHKSDYAKFEVCAHKWCDLSENGCGISLLSDSKYGVGCNGGQLGLSLQKSGTHPDARGDNGTSRFRYAIMPHNGTVGAETVRAGYSFNIRPVVTCRQNLAPSFTVSGDESVITETVKYGENGGIALRLYESLGGSAKVVVSSACKQIVLTNMLEDELRVLSDNGSAELCFRPFEIKTIVLR